MKVLKKNHVSKPPEHENIMFLFYFLKLLFYLLKVPLHSFAEPIMGNTNFFITIIMIRDTISAISAGRWFHGENEENGARG